MRQRTKTALLLAAAMAWIACGPEPARTPAPGGAEKIAPLLENLGDLHHRVSTRSAEAQRYFDQGLRLVYGFNHEEAARSFRQAAALDPYCAMHSWGLALALAPNINDPLPSAEREQEAYQAIQKALKLLAEASPAERDYVTAMAKRFAPTGQADRLALNRSYAGAMAVVWQRHREDPDAGALYADAIMNTMPWNYWTRDGKPRPGTEQIVATLEDVMRRFPDHPGAHHLYIHAVEASPDPKRGVPSAEKLGSLMPAAGHIVHMPAHIYIRVGRYADASEANVRAIEADNDYITQCRSQGLYAVGYHPHNIHFLWTASILEGRYEASIQSARQLAAKVHEEHMHVPELATVQLFTVAPVLTLARFGHWDETLAEPLPAKDVPFVEAVWRYSRGLAYARKGQIPQAEAELSLIERIAADPQLAAYKIFGQNGLDEITVIAREVLAGEIAGARGDLDRALSHMDRATRLDDALVYNEPPDWYFPPRHALGALLLQANRPKEAEMVYWEDLRRNPENGWSLFGLQQSLAAQGKQEEARQMGERFQKAWRRSDVRLTASRF